MTRAILALIANTLLMAPPDGAASAQEEPGTAAVASESDSSDEARYLSAIEKLGYGITRGNDHPKEAISLLEEALGVLPEFTLQLANDPDALALRAGGYVSLARAYIIVRDEGKAIEAMDEGIRSAPFGKALPATAYGPRVEKLWKKRDAEAKRAAREDVLVGCWVKCRIYLNERSVEVDASEPVGEGEFATQVSLGGLSAGTYRLWIEAEDGSGDPLIVEFEPGEVGAEPLAFTFGTEPEPEREPEGPELAPEPIAEPALVVEAPAPVKRLLPRPVEISAIAAGVGLIASGAVLFAINGKCANDALTKDAVPSDGNEICPSVWATDVAGIALMGAGGALSVAGGVMLGIDEVRGARGRKAARINVGWSFRF